MTFADVFPLITLGPVLLAAIAAGLSSAGWIDSRTYTAVAWYAVISGGLLAFIFGRALVGEAPAVANGVVPLAVKLNLLAIPFAFAVVFSDRYLPTRKSEPTVEEVKNANQ